MRLRFRKSVWIFAMLLAAAGPATALDNLLPNGDFDGGAGTAHWDALSSPSDMTLLTNLGVDADDCPGSTSMRDENTGTTDGKGTLASTCATSFAPGTSYDASAEAKFLDTTTSCSVALDVDYFASTDCSGAPLAHYPAPPFHSGTSTDWFLLGDGVPPGPATTQSVAVRIRFIKDFAADAQANVNIDRVRLAPTGLVFAEDFEIGATCRWSVVQP